MYCNNTSCIKTMVCGVATVSMEITLILQQVVVTLKLVGLIHMQ